MKIKDKNIDYIRVQFSKMKTRQDFLSLLNYAKPLVYTEKCKPFELKQITYYSNPERTKKAYKKFEIKKKSGGTRVIYSPEKELKEIQKTLALILQCVFKPHQAAKGFVTGSSIVDNAAPHINQNYVYNTDLKDFFPSIDQARVWACLKLVPFNLTDNEYHKDDLNVETGVRIFQTDHNEKIFYKVKRDSTYFINDKKGNRKRYFQRLSKEADDAENELIEKGQEFDFESRLNIFDKYSVVRDSKKYVFSDPNMKQLRKMQTSRLMLANMIASITCVEIEVERIDESGNIIKLKKNVLPQGAPTSPILSNVICQRLDFLLTGLAKRFNLKYTRYADDLTFSSMHNVYSKNGSFRKELNRIIDNQNFRIKKSKNRLQKRGYRQEVTGIIVNDKTNVRKRYIKQIRMWLYYWEKYGYKKARQIFKKDYIADKGHVKNHQNSFKKVLGGKLEYLKMVKGEDDSTYLKLKRRYERLSINTVNLNKILNIWEENGITEAIIHYKGQNRIESYNKLEFKTVQKFESSIQTKRSSIKNNKIIFFDNNDKETEVIHIPNKYRKLLDEDEISDLLNDNDNILNVIVNGYGGKNWLYIPHLINTEKKRHINNKRSHKQKDKHIDEKIMDKYEFIAELLKKRSITHSQKERMYNLIAKEVKYVETNNSDILKRVEKIEKLLNKKQVKSNELSKEDKHLKSGQSNLYKYIDPYNQYKFLFEYNQNQILRHTCHDIDSAALETVKDYCSSETYDFTKHLKIIIQEFEKHSKRFFAPKVAPLIRGYLTGKDYKGKQLKKGWTTDNIKVNWSSPELLLWTQQNQGTPPNLNESLAGNQEIELLSIEPQVNSPITNDPIQNFTQLVLHFKNLFHIKSGKQSLRSIIDRNNFNKKWNNQIDFELYDNHFHDNLEHFTNVDKLMEAYNKILKIIIEQHYGDKKPKVKLCFYEEDKRVYLSIHHLNGQFNKTLQNCIDRPYGRDYKDLINKQINGLCNLYLYADFGNQEFAKINLWDSRKLETYKLDRFIGVEHRLEFPKIREL